MGFWEMSLPAFGCYLNGMGTFSEDPASWYTLTRSGHSERFPQAGLTPTLPRLWHQNENGHDTSRRVQLHSSKEVLLPPPRLG